MCFISASLQKLWSATAQAICRSLRLWAMKPHGRSERIESLRCRPAKMVTTTPCWMKTTTRLMAVRLITLNCPCSKSAGIFWNPSGWSAGNCGQCSMRMSWSRLLKSADRRWWSMTLSLSLLLSSTVLQRTSTPMNIWIRSMMCRRISKKSRQILPLVIRLRIVSS